MSFNCMSWHGFLQVFAHTEIKNAIHCFFTTKHYTNITNLILLCIYWKSSLFCSVQASSDITSPNFHGVIFSESVIQPNINTHVEHMYFDISSHDFRLNRKNKDKETSVIINRVDYVEKKSTTNNIKWSSNHDEAPRQIQTVLNARPFLRLPNLSRENHIFSDSSAIAGEDACARSMMEITTQPSLSALNSRQHNKDGQFKSRNAGLWSFAYRN